jgi:hypothetical protein
MDLFAALKMGKDAHVLSRFFYALSLQVNKNIKESWPM